MGESVLGASGGCFLPRMCRRCHHLNRCQEAGRGNQDGDVETVYWFCMVKGM